jgi:hypothetical protein
MNDREHTAMGIYWVLFSTLMIFCLVGAFVLPPRLVFNKWIGCAGLAGFFVGIPVLIRVADRSRIGDAVQEIGGQLIRVERMPEDWWYQRGILGTKFEVVYVDLTGSTHRALCRTGFVQGVNWLEDTVVSAEYLES